jgi:hypothetical protein
MSRDRTEKDERKGRENLAGIKPSVAKPIAMLFGIIVLAFFWSTFFVKLEWQVLFPGRYSICYLLKLPHHGCTQSFTSSDGIDSSQVKVNIKIYQRKRHSISYLLCCGNPSSTSIHKYKR